MTLNDFVTHTYSRLELTLKKYLIENPSPASTLQKAVEYATLNGGKHIRPLLVYLIGRTLGASWENLDPPASAVELIHVYSLIHDDLPAMDNSDLRRGKPSCHKAFDEATAILAGDALQPLAFEIITTHPSPLTAQQRLEMVKILSQASGIHGMAAGQMLDIEKTSSIDLLTQMYQLKTGALLNAAVKLGIVSAGISDPNIFNSLLIFAENIGLAFQIQDDLLDIEGATTIGKPKRIDQANQKITHLSLLGIEKSRKKIEMLFDTAVRSLNFLGEKSNLLCEFATLLMQRNH